MKQVNTIPGFEDVQDYYYVSREGNVFGFKGKMRPGNSGRECNYKTARLRTKDGEYKNARVHRLVALAFIPNPEGKPQVNHLDEDPSNNHVDNLEWATNRENAEYSRAHAIVGVCIKTQKTIRFHSMSEASRYGFKQGAISRCISGELKSHGGYTWVRDNEEGAIS